jgi:hypothetical protein
VKKGLKILVVLSFIMQLFCKTTIFAESFPTLNSTVKFDASKPDLGLKNIPLVELNKILGIDQPTPTPIYKSTWFKSKNESKIAAIDGGILWSPVTKPTTLHSYFTPVELKTGDSIVFSMQWESDGMDGSNKDFDGSTSNPTNQGTGISDKYLRCLAGTGDFRIGFFQSDEKVENDSFEADGSANKFNNYKGFQIRIEPHLSAGFKNLNGRLIEDKGSDSESHNNITAWTRINPGKNGLMSDEAQKFDHSGFSKEDGWGTQPQSWGPNLPFGKPKELKIKYKVISANEYELNVTLNDNESPLLRGKYNGSFYPNFFDTIAITYTNSSRKYAYVKIRGFKVLKENVPIPPTPVS